MGAQGLPELEPVPLDSLFEAGFKAVFVALGAHKSLALDLPDEDVEFFIMMNERFGMKNGTSPVSK